MSWHCSLELVEEFSQANCLDGEQSAQDSEPEIQRMGTRMAYRVDRLKAIGNGQVPAVAYEAWRVLNDV